MNEESKFIPTMVIVSYNNGCVLITEVDNFVLYKKLLAQGWSIPIRIVYIDSKDIFIGYEYNDR